MCSVLRFSYGLGGICAITNDIKLLFCIPQQPVVARSSELCKAYSTRASLVSLEIFCKIKLCLFGADFREKKYYTCW